MAKAKTKSSAPAKARGTLKVFRMPIGFHDAFVAAPSQKAALEAWGSESNLFAQGVAELVTDPTLTAEPLARPGEVVRRLRGSADEQVAALGSTGSSAKKEAGSRIKSGMTKKAKQAPRPSRAAVDKAEQALERAAARHREALDKLRAEEQALQKRRLDLEAKQRSEREALSDRADAAREHYRAAMAEWAG
jgi:hypothetical protein